MELGKSSSESHSEESDSTKDEGSVKRTYECTFCKRGFTNAQALGGHMNIHRKDRAKGTQTPTKAAATNRRLSGPYSINPNPVGSVSAGVPANSDLGKEEEGRRRNHEGLIRASASVPLNSMTCSESYFGAESFHSSTRSSNDAILDANLSLQIGPSSMESISEVKRDEKRDEVEVDLELRLGLGRGH